MKPTININHKRLEYLLRLFRLSQDELLDIISKGLKNRIHRNHIFSNNISVSNLKKIDRVFQRGLPFYTDPKDISYDEKSSIFLRKRKFNTNLGLGDKQLINNIEGKVNHLCALQKITNYKVSRKLNTFSIKYNPEHTGYEIRDKFNLVNDEQKDRDFLKKLIELFAQQNILVFEFIEPWNKKNKANLDGFFIAPNIIAVKRNKDSFKKEIFTLAHELAHYLLDDEEVDTDNSENYSNKSDSLNNIERWCDAFAFAFLTGKDIKKKLQNIPSHKIYHNNETINKIANNCHISKLSIFTNLTNINIGSISWQKYASIKDKLNKDFLAKKADELAKKEQNKLINQKLGIKSQGFSAKPIYSPLEQDIFRNAFFEGVVSEYDVLTNFKIKDIDKFLYE